MTDIVIPVCNSMPYLKFTLDSLKKSTGSFDNIIIVESESTDRTKEYIDNLELLYKDIKVYHTPKEGIASAINKGIKMSDSDVYLTQDDVFFPKILGRDWLKEMKEMSKDKEIGLITTIRGSRISGKKYKEGLRWVGTWSCYIPRRTIKKVGLFDENMSPGDDIDYSYRVQNKGLKIGRVDYWVQHHRATEHKVDNQKEINKQSKYFRKKHDIK